MKSFNDLYIYLSTYVVDSASSEDSSFDFPSQTRTVSRLCPYNHIKIINRVCSYRKSVYGLLVVELKA